MDGRLAFPGKKGACFTRNHLDKARCLHPAWHYTWGWDGPGATTDNAATTATTNTGCGDSVMEWVPMVWGGAKSTEIMQQGLDERVVPHIASGSIKRLLAFNEPDAKRQSNMTVKRSLEFWPLLEQLGVPLVSPSCAHPLGFCPPRMKEESISQDATGTWMRDFMRDVEERHYRVDYIGVHWYGGPNPTAFQTRMRAIYDTYGGGRPLVLSEFAVADWSVLPPQPQPQPPAHNRFLPGQVLAFMKVVLPWMEAQDWIAAYSWFSFDIACRQGTSSALFDADGKLTACGEYYKSVSPENPLGDQSITI